MVAYKCFFHQLFSYFYFYRSLLRYLIFQELELYFKILFIAGENYVGVMIISIIINDIIGLLIHKNKMILRKIFLIIGVFLNLLILVHFKYTSFLIEN